ncbi:MAG: hypothetical protein D3916_18510, partial [Candidatus Electrothrix sp. MAN1_4]|nr:hypothetical protein [Candidatus Electrothrix sp. MAN1_4]
YYMEDNQRTDCSFRLSLKIITVTEAYAFMHPIIDNAALLIAPGITCIKAVSVSFKSSYYDINYHDPCIAWRWKDDCSVECTASTGETLKGYYDRLVVNVVESYADGSVNNTYKYYFLVDNVDSLEEVGLINGSCGACKDEVLQVCSTAPVTWDNEKKCLYTCDFCEPGRQEYGVSHSCTAVTVSAEGGSCAYACSGCEEYYDAAKSACP